MKLTTNWEKRAIQNRVRELGINPNDWCNPVSWVNGLKPGELLDVKVWQQTIQGWLTNFLDFRIAGDRVRNCTISVKSSCYPDYRSSFKGISSLSLMSLPVERQETYFFSLLFLKIRLPEGLLRKIPRQFVSLIWSLFFKNFSTIPRTRWEADNPTT